MDYLIPTVQRIPNYLIQSMILPAVDSMKNTVLQKGMSASFEFSHDHPTDRDHRPTSHTKSSCSYLSAGRDHDPAHIRQKDHRSDGCSHSKWEINAFDDLYDGTIIYPVRGIDRILNQR